MSVAQVPRGTKRHDHGDDTLRARAARGSIPPQRLASRSVIPWCHEPARQCDRETPRHQAWLPPAPGQSSTPWRIAPVRSPASPPRSRRGPLDGVGTHGAGLEVQPQTVMACRVTPDPTGPQADGSMALQPCGTMTRALRAWSDWLAAVGVTPVAMESPGDSWRPVSHLRAGHVTRVLVNAAHVKQVPGRKTDKAEARWLAHLMRDGLRQASVIPPHPRVRCAT